jgi:hypothetical protein
MDGEGVRDEERRGSGFLQRQSAPKEKRGVPRLHENMLPGNSFPQICVVSINKIVEIGSIAQEYLRVVA